MASIHVDEAALNALKNALEGLQKKQTDLTDNEKRSVRTYGEDTQSLARLTSLIEEITSGDIQGDPANDLLQKFQAKQDTFNKLTQTIEEAEGYMGLQTTKFGNMIGDLKSGMK